MGRNAKCWCCSTDPIMAKYNIRCLAFFLFCHFGIPPSLFSLSSVKRREFAYKYCRVIELQNRDKVKLSWLIHSLISPLPISHSIRGQRVENWRPWWIPMFLAQPTLMSPGCEFSISVYIKRKRNSTAFPSLKVLTDSIGSLLEISEHITY
jgi:hypothetical protein